VCNTWSLYFWIPGPKCYSRPLTGKVSPGTNKVACGPDLTELLVLGQTHSFAKLPTKHTLASQQKLQMFGTSPWDQDQGPHPGTVIPRLEYEVSDPQSLTSSRIVTPRRRTAGVNKRILTQIERTGINNDILFRWEITQQGQEETRRPPCSWQPTKAHCASTPPHPSNELRHCICYNLQRRDCFMV
jgi:hypothetical protein